MPMTKKDYELIAGAVSRAKHGIVWPSPTTLPVEAKDQGVNLTARTIAAALQADNPRFDPDRFLKACGL